MGSGHAPTKSRASAFTGCLAEAVFVVCQKIAADLHQPPICVAAQNIQATQAAEPREDSLTAQEEIEPQ